MNNTKNFLLRILLFIVTMPFVIALVAFSAIILCIAVVVLGVAIVFKSAYNILFK